MKIAYIDYLIPDEIYGETEIIERGLKARGIEVELGSDLEEFLKKHGSFDKFDGVIIHPGYKKQKKIIEIHKDNPNLPIVFVTNSVEDYTNEDIPLFNYQSIDKIYAFLVSKSTKKLEKDILVSN